VSYKTIRRGVCFRTVSKPSLPSAAALFAGAPPAYDVQLCTMLRGNPFWSAISSDRTKQGKENGQTPLLRSSILYTAMCVTGSAVPRYGCTSYLSSLCSQWGSRAQACADLDHHCTAKRGWNWWDTLFLWRHYWRIKQTLVLKGVACSCYAACSLILYHLGWKQCTYRRMLRL